MRDLGGIRILVFSLYIYLHGIADKKQHFEKYSFEDGYGIDKAVVIRIAVTIDARGYSVIYLIGQTRRCSMTRNRVLMLIFAILAIVAGVVGVKSYLDD